MPPPHNRPAPGISRAALKDRPPGRASSAGAAPPAPAPAPPPRPVTPPPSAMAEFLQIFGGVALTLLVLAGLLLVLHLMRDSMAVGRYLAEAKAQRSTLVCQDGRMVRGDGSIRDILLADPHFLCTDWKTLQSIELEESKGR